MGAGTGTLVRSQTNFARSASGLRTGLDGLDEGRAGLTGRMMPRGATHEDSDKRNVQPLLAESKKHPVVEDLVGCQCSNV